MARPIAPTPPLSGNAALEFVSNILKNTSAPAEERARVREGASRISSMLTFNF